MRTQKRASTLHSGPTFYWIACAMPPSVILAWLSSGSKICDFRGENTDFDDSMHVSVIFCPKPLACQIHFIRYIPFEQLDHDVLRLSLASSEVQHHKLQDSRIYTY